MNIAVAQSKEASKCNWPLSPPNTRTRVDRSTSTDQPVHRQPLLRMPEDT